MKIVCQQGDLAAALAIAARGVSQRSTVQILSGILLRADGSLELAATDMELSLRVPVAARVEEPGSVVLPGRLLLDIVKALPSAEVTIEQPLGSGAVKIACGQSEYTLHAQGAEDFPHLPEADGHPVQRRSRGLRRRRCRHVSRAASRDESRPVLTGVLVEFSEGSVTMAATDSYRLVGEDRAAAGLDRREPGDRAGARPRLSSPGSRRARRSTSGSVRIRSSSGPTA